MECYKFVLKNPWTQKKVLAQYEYPSLNICKKKGEKKTGESFETPCIIGLDSVYEFAFFKYTLLSVKK